MDALKKTAKGLPQEPGIYRFFDDDKTILYIGKAKNIKKRVSSYFSKNHNDLKTLVLVKKIKSLDFIQTKSEAEALILEDQLIKHHQPRYNIQLKDDKSYPYIKITNEAFPRLIVTRYKKQDNARYFGPFPSLGSSRKLTQNLLDIFKLRDCKQHISLNNPEPKCIQMDIGNCLGPCIKKNTKADYDVIIKNLCLFLEGKNGQLTRRLKKEMRESAKNLNFERAAELRDIINRLEHLNQKQYVSLDKHKNLSVFVGIEHQNIVYFLFQRFLNGKLVENRGVFSEKKETKNHIALFLEATKQLIDTKKEPLLPLVSNVFIEELAKECDPLCQNLSIQVPKKGIKSDLVKQALLNAKQALKQLSNEKTSVKQTQNISSKLAKILKRPLPIHYIIGFDISHYFAQDIVASAVSFQDGTPAKELYRHFHIKSLTENKSNDPKAIFEVVLRRLNACYKENLIPDLLLIDGGKPQLNAALKAHQESALAKHDIYIVALAKKNEELYFEDQNKPLRLSKRDPSLKLLQRIRDEAHRFANRLQQNIRHKRQLT